MTDLGITSPKGGRVRGVWQLKDLADIGPGGTMQVKGVAGQSSRFYKIRRI